MDAPDNRPHRRPNWAALLGISSIALFLALLLSQPSNLAAQTPEDCLACHQNKDLHRQGGRGGSLYVDAKALAQSPHTKLSCLDCHTGFDMGKTPHKPRIEPVNCVLCHADAPAKHGPHKSVIESATGPDRNASCKTCHGTHNVGSNPPDACSKCHADQKAQFEQSAHGRALAAGAAGAPTCLTCHVKDVTSGTAPGKSEVRLKQDQAKLCLSCHLDNPDIRARAGSSAGFIEAFESSVHGSALAHGNGKAANCVNCHGAHEMKKGVEPSARVNKANVSTTCGQCHGDIATQYRDSIHGQAVARGHFEAPTCTDCHGEHSILHPEDPRSPVAPQNLSQQVCGRCHAQVRLSDKFGIASDRFQTFSDSFHGLALRNGNIHVANCASCHGVHNIKPPSDPASTINKANLVQTCGKCHPGAGTKFAMGRVHVAVTQQKAPALFWITMIYTVLIVLTIGGMVSHNLLDFIRKSRDRVAERYNPAPPQTGTTTYLRMNASERWEHGALMVSFITLAITGFMLHYPDAWWVQWTRHAIGPLFQLRGAIHRIAAVVMVVTSIHHILYLMFSARGRQMVKDMLPHKGDGRDVLAAFRYYLGIRKERPKAPRFTYVEKSEYWALVWGTTVMSVTGLLMWFENVSINFITKLGWDISRTIHYYEAWLAVLAILVWHLYFVLLNPDIYPMNLAWLTGRLSEREMAEEHALELEEIKRGERTASDDPMPPRAQETGHPSAKPATAE